ncbi:alkaline phosphatase family protein [Sinomicrobium sp.]
MKRFLVIAVFLFGLQGGAQQMSYKDVLKNEVVSNAVENTDKAIQKPYVVMVSIDGFRHDYAEKYRAQHILELQKNGSSTRRLIPSFPSKTFPNHYSLITGLYPEHHGIVSNVFYDPNTKKRYSIGNKDAVENGDWYQGIPLWNLAQLQGICAASYFWVGSEADVNGMHPKYYYPYNKQTPYEYRVKRVLEWLQLPEKLRPHLITLYFSEVDTQGHRFGPDAEETRDAVAYVDQQIGALRTGLEKLDLPVYLIVTSDHGMDELSQLINIRDYAEVDNDHFYGGPVAMIYTESEAETERLYEQLSQQSLFAVYRRENVPNYLNYSDNDKIGDLVLIADAPYTIVNLTELPSLQKLGGMHGYDPFENKNMGGIFYIEGPGIKKNYSLPPIENVNIYPLVAKLLGIKIISEIDGALSTTNSIFLNSDGFE